VQCKLLHNAYIHSAVIIAMILPKANLIQQQQQQKQQQRQQQQQ